MKTVTSADIDFFNNKLRLLMFHAEVTEETILRILVI